MSELRRLIFGILFGVILISVISGIESKLPIFWVFDLIALPCAEIILVSFWFYGGVGRIYALLG